MFYFRATLAAIGGFLDAFQKVADMATGSRGKIASRELRGKYLMKYDLDWCYSMWGVSTEHMCYLYFWLAAANSSARPIAYRHAYAD